MEFSLGAVFERRQDRRKDSGGKRYRAPMLAAGGGFQEEQRRGNFQIKSDEGSGDRRHRVL
jgi:hypothetical protein